MTSTLYREFLRLVLLAVGAGVIGYFFDVSGWAVSMALGWVLIGHLRELIRLHSWLNENPEDEEAPEEGKRLWGEVFNRIYVLQREEHQARANLQSVIDRARSSIGALEEAVVLIDRFGNLEWWNTAAGRLLGLKHPNDAGQPVTNFIRDPRFVEYFEARDYREPLKLPSFLRPAQYLQFELTLFGDNDRLLICWDVTRLHNLEQMRKDFVANVSHELRTPLTVVSGYLETLLSSDETLTPRWTRALKQMEQQTGRMTNIVNDLLMLSRLENQSPSLEHKPLDVGVMLSQIRQEGLAYAPEKQQSITLDTDPDLRVLGSENDLRSAFLNLVTNAVKYTPANGEIRIRWWSDANGAYMSVTDNGIGIDPKHIPRLTERFYRADPSRSNATGGTGLGLAIVKHVLLQHGARLDISSALGKGSTFTCVFPERALAP